MTLSMKIVSMDRYCECLVMLFDDSTPNNYIPVLYSVLYQNISIEFLKLAAIYDTKIFNQALYVYLKSYGLSVMF